MGPSGLSASGQILKVWNSDRREYRNEQHQLQCTRITRLKPPASTSQSLPTGSVASGSGSMGTGAGARSDLSGVSGVSVATVGGGTTQATCLAVDEGLASLAIGFQNGTVLLFRGDITRDKCVSSSLSSLLFFVPILLMCELLGIHYLRYDALCNRHSKPTCVLDGPSPITGIAFRAANPSRGCARPVLFVVTERDVRAVHLGDRDKIEKVCGTILLFILNISFSFLTLFRILTRT